MTIKFTPNGGVEVNLFPVLNMSVTSPSNITYAGKLTDNEVPLFFYNLTKLKKVKMSCQWVNKTVTDGSDTYKIVDYLMVKPHWGILTIDTNTYTVYLDISVKEHRVAQGTAYKATLTFEVIE
ncbi:MAG: hypothetical protein ACTSQA_07675 [Candidatus Heimdallarchaeaceae archaeon]